MKDMNGIGSPLGLHSDTTYSLMDCELFLKMSMSFEGAMLDLAKLEHMRTGEKGRSPCISFIP